MSKLCSTCKVDKDEDLFRKAKNKCKSCEAESLKLWRLNNKDKVKKQIQDSNNKRKEEGWISAKKYREAHPYQKKGRYIRTALQKKADDNKAKAAWKLAHPEEVKEHNARRRAKIRGVKVEKVYRKVVFERDNGVCGICNTNIIDKYELDHIVPISKNGDHSYSNIQLAHPTCNRKKHNKFTLITDR